MVLAQDPKGVKTFIPPSADRHLPDEKRFTVTLKIFSVQDTQRLENRVTAKKAKAGSFNRGVLEEGVIDWFNLEDVKKVDGKVVRTEVPYDGPEDLEKISSRVRREIVQELLEVNELDEDDEGN